MAAILAILGACLITLGVALLCWEAGIIAAGVFLLGAAAFVDLTVEYEYVEPEQ
jgi:hypothetical protein